MTTPTLDTLKASLNIIPLDPVLGNPPEVTARIHEALKFAEEAHRGQTRKNALKTPYIYHPMAVAEIASSAAVDHVRKVVHPVVDDEARKHIEPIARIVQAQAAEAAEMWYINVVQAALLHDVVEDTETTLEDIMVAFGEGVSDIVKQVTDDRSPEVTAKQRKQAQIEHAGKMTIGAKVVKLADKLHNCSSTLHDAPPAWSVARCQGSFAWCKTVTDQMRGFAPDIDARLDALFAGKFHHPIHGEHPCIPSDKPLEKQVSEYLDSLQ